MFNRVICFNYFLYYFIKLQNFLIKIFYKIKDFHKKKLNNLFFNGKSKFSI